jgi:hypothetical protein
MGQVDTVAHCGGSMAGEFIFSCGYIDVASGWCLYRAQWNKGMIATQESLSHIQQKIYFPLSMIHPDCGTEFLNQFVIQWADTMHIDITRSRSYHKNDNGYIEQRNNHIVRKWFGYVRLEHRELVPLMNEFYELLAVWKEVEGKRTRKIYEKTGKTPYQRILERDDVLDEIKEKLQKEHETLDPFTMHTELHKRRGAILDLNRQLTKERKVTNS